MRILFVTDKRVNAGSIQAVAAYIYAGEKLGHTFAVYGSPDPTFPNIRFSVDADAFDFVVFILESKLDWLSGLRAARVLSAVPHERRVVLDADGMYNDVVSVGGYDRNHATTADRDRWREACEKLGNRIFQPTLSPLDPRVESLLFYGYAPELQVHQNGTKHFDIVHVCHNWWRWKELEEHFFPVIGQHRDRIGEICFLGLWWDACPPWASAIGLKDAFQVDSKRLKSLRITVRPPVPFVEVIPLMSSAKVNIMTQRPLFQQLGIITSKYFEILCADTIPLALAVEELVRSIYGPAGSDLALRNGIGQRLLDALERPEHYRQIVEQVREHVRIHHSYTARVHQLVEALQS